MSDNVINFPSESTDSKLTDENVDQILSKINEVTEGQEVPTRDYTEEERTGFSETVDVTVNPLTGERNILSQDEDDYITAELSDFVTSDFNVELDDETIEKSLKDSGIDSVKELSEFMQLIKEYRLNDGKVSDLYNRLPSSIKRQIDGTIAENGGSVALKDIRKVRTMMAKDIINSFIQDAEFNQMSVDLDKQLDGMVKEYSKEMADLYKGSIEEKIKELSKISDELLDKGERDKSDTIASIVEALKESYELSTFKESIGSIKVKKFAIEKPNKIFEDFRFKYEDSNFTIQDPATLPTIIAKHTGCDFVDALDFVLAFCLYCKNFRPDNVAQHTFMYYFIANVISLNIIAPDKEYDEFTSKLVDNIKECIDIRKK